MDQKVNDNLAKDDTSNILSALSNLRNTDSNDVSSGQFEILITSLENKFVKRLEFIENKLKQISDELYSLKGESSVNGMKITNLDAEDKRLAAMIERRFLDNNDNLEKLQNLLKEEIEAIYERIENETIKITERVSDRHGTRKKTDNKVNMNESNSYERLMDQLRSDVDDYIIRIKDLEKIVNNIKSSDKTLMIFKDIAELKEEIEKKASKDSHLSTLDHLAEIDVDIKLLKEGLVNLSDDSKLQDEISLLRQKIEGNTRRLNELLEMEKNPSGGKQKQLEIDLTKFLEKSEFKLFIEKYLKERDLNESSITKLFRKTDELNQNQDTFATRVELKECESL